MINVKKSKQLKRLLFYISVLLGVISIWLGSYFWINKYCGDADGPGTFGDQFGAVNALFTGLSLAGIIITLWQQQQELSAQRREFMTSRAMTIVYKQIELLTNIISNLNYPLLSYSDGKDNIEKNGINVVMWWNTIIEKVTYKIETNILIVTKMRPLLSSLSNSVRILNKTRENESMSDDDALFVFESFKYNIDHRVWTFIETLRQVNWDDTVNDLKDIKNDVQNISSFLDEVESLKNNTNSSK